MIHFKKLHLSIAIIAVILIGLFLWLLAARSPNKETLAVDAPPQPNSEHSEQNTNEPEVQNEQEQKTTAPDQADNDQEVNLNQAAPVASPLDEATATKPDEPQENAIEKDHGDSFITKKLTPWGFQNSTSRKIDTIIIHSSYDALGNEPYDVDGLLQVYKQYGVSAHYLISRKGQVYQLVADEDIAYHAGVSSVPDGRTNVNFFSIGVELMNTKEDEYTAAQYQSLNKLLELLNQRYEIKYTLGHSDIAPDRKDDPWNFNWDEIGK